MKNDAAGMKEQAIPGLAGWVLQRLRGGFSQARVERRMQVAETLSLGGKRQLLLVVCDGQRFLVGASGESVGSIIALGNERLS